MAEGRADDEMIEIGDPTEESPTPEGSPQVVIQYHERGGVPWMLIPPLLFLSAVGAIMLYQRLAPRLRPAQPPALSKADETPGPPSENPAAAPTPAVAVEAPNPVGVVVDATPAPTPPPALPVTPAELVAEQPVQAPQPDPAPFPRVAGLGFDPKALEAERKAEAPADPGLAPAARDDVPDDRDKPREVDPDLLPPDPRQARVRQQQRRLDVLKKGDEERARFHADLKAICSLKFRKDTAKKLEDLRKRYVSRVDPGVESRAADLLGKSGKYAGADRRTRIEVLRALGYPEPNILGDLYDHYGTKSLGERDGPSSLDEALYQSAQFLLRSPPPGEAPSRAVSNITNAPGGRANRPSSASGEAGPDR
jgi:hypothetical protein